MNAQFAAPKNRPPMAVIESLVAEHGAIATLKAVMLAMVRRDRIKAIWLNSDLNEHLRRDIGLDPEPRARAYWELR